MTQVAYRPVFQREGPATACVLHGQELGWMACTPLSGAMGLDKATIGRIVISGCQLRDETGDYAGGVTLPQVAAVIESHGVHVELHVGAGVCSPAYAAVNLRAGRAFILQGNTLPSGRGNVNHAILVNDCWGGTMTAPAFAAVFDPWSKGIAAWTWGEVLLFAAALRPYGEADPRQLGPGKFYAGILPDVEPHVALWSGARETVPFPDHQVVAAKAGTDKAPNGEVRVRLGPSKQYKVADTKPGGTPFLAYQYKPNGGWFAGSRGWYGNDDGNRWIHESGLIGRGGNV